MIIRLASGFADLGYQVDLVVVNAKGASYSEVPPTARMVDFGARNIYASFPALVGYLRKKKPEALISALELTNLLVLLARRISRVHTRMVVQLTTTMSKHKRTPTKKK